MTREIKEDERLSIELGEWQTRALEWERRALRAEGDLEALRKRVGNCAQCGTLIIVWEGGPRHCHACGKWRNGSDR